MKVQTGKTSFAKDGLRVLTPAMLTEAEWNFSALADENAATAQSALAYELARECEHAHRFAEEFRQASKHSKLAPAFRRRWLGRPAVSPQYLGVFPMPCLAFPAKARRVHSIEWATVCEMEAGMFAEHLKGGFPSVTYHRLAIDWRRGKPHAKAALLKWFAAIPKPPIRKVTQRGTAGMKPLADAFAQLSAWRAQRAGLSQGDYNAMLAAKGFKPAGKNRGFVRTYSDPSAFRNAAKRGAARIHRRFAR